MRMKDSYHDIDEFLKDWNRDVYPEHFAAIRSEVSMLASTASSTRDVVETVSGAASAAALRIASNMLRDYDALVRRS